VLVASEAKRLKAAALSATASADVQVGRCSLTLIQPRTDPAWFLRFNVKYDGSFSNVAFNCCNLRPSVTEIVVQRSNAAVSLTEQVNQRVKEDTLAVGQAQVAPKLTPQG
jgi:hypothetical protein